MKNEIKDRDNKIESLKKTIKLLKNKGEVNKLNDVLKKRLKNCQSGERIIDMKIQSWYRYFVIKFN